MLEVRLAKKDEISELQVISREVIAYNYLAYIGDEAVDWFISSGESDKYIS